MTVNEQINVTQNELCLSPVSNAIGPCPLKTLLNKNFISIRVFLSVDNLFDYGEKVGIHGGLKGRINSATALL